MNVARSELREALEELRLVGPPGLLPSRLPGLVSREIAAGVEVPAAELVVLLHREGVEVLEDEPVLGLPGLRAAELVARTLGLEPPLARDAGPTLRFLWHLAIA